MALAEAPAAAAAAEAADGMVWADAGAGGASGGGSDSDDEEGGLAAYADEAPADGDGTVRQAAADSFWSSQLRQLRSRQLLQMVEAAVH